MTITEIKKLATEGKSPYFFSKETMQFFNSKVYRDVKKVEDGFLFITSEVFGNDSRHYRIRKIKPNGSINSGKKFNCLKSAKNYLKSF
tara:strand:- start:525 stop:788 length:264 start_codon:yes stop_codon:yes gene_type:complete